MLQWKFEVVFAVSQFTNSTSFQVKLAPFSRFQTNQWRNHEIINLAPFLRFQTNQWRNHEMLT
ncbi:hypothetical protein DERP_015049 [Dermatophagoides pteronyssinus]|uniref:Uncharacterized protein n=1 Tax=Dermatophagoides pteronyssinus TaxID=6956 RepID=A0ABQ8J6B7_DERPT|nr:hypothetical protein DERP_015049 [Dermatophagoides pteronyssinus]